MAGIGIAKKGLGLLGKKKRPRTKAEMIERIRQLDPKIYGKDIATFGSGIERKQMKKMFSKGKK
jgi:hypothetical protein|tara:strand:+ start:327 stop:518 length:192 start_codon:yes stop_codon:yes gene_type:complete